MNEAFIRRATKAAQQRDIVYALDQLELAEENLPELAESIKYYKAELALRNNRANKGHQARIIVPAFNAIDYLEQCIISIENAWTSIAYELVIVNDGSNEFTTKRIRLLAADYGFQVIENRVNLGYTRSVNIGLRESKEEYIVILNSDTQVTDGWLDRLIRCAESSPIIGIVGPLSNAATYQNVPLLYQDEQFAINTLPRGMTANDMAKIVRRSSSSLYPRVPVVNGFCYLVKKSALIKIGLLDEDLFPMGYGEENDYCIRASQLGIELAIADDAYVYHAKSKSFGMARKKELSRLGRESLDNKYGKEMVKNIISQLEDNQNMKLIRNRIRERVSDAINVTRTPREIEDPLGDSSFGVLFLLPCKGHGGGIHSVIQEALGLRRIGIRARVAINQKHFSHYIDIYREIKEIQELLMPVHIDGELNLLKADSVMECSSYSVVVATIYTSVRMLADICRRLPGITPAYYIQDYEPFFSEAGTPEHQEALSSYTLIPNILAFAKTDWLIDTLKTRHQLDVKKVMPSLDHSVYKPWLESMSTGSCHVISAMIRPSTPRRGASRTMEFLQRLHDELKEAIQIEVFGCEETDPEYQSLPNNFPLRHHGRIRREEVASILSRSTIFLDLSDYQAFGRTGIEAMASGCIPVLPEQGGVHEYAKHMYNSLIIDTNRSQDYVAVVTQILQDNEKVWEIKVNAVSTASHYSILGASISILKVLRSASATIAAKTAKT